MGEQQGNGAAADTQPDPPATLPDPDSAAWRRRMGAALTDGNVGAIGDLLLAGIAKPATPELGA